MTEITESFYHIQDKPYEKWTVEKNINKPATGANQAWLYQIIKGDEYGKNTGKKYGYFSKPDKSLCEKFDDKVLADVYFDPNLTVDAQRWQVTPGPVQIVCVYWKNPDVKTGGFQQPCKMGGTCDQGYVCSKTLKQCLKGPGNPCSNGNQCSSGICTDDRCNFEQPNNLTIYIVVILIILAIVYFIIIYKKNNIKNDVA